MKKRSIKEIEELLHSATINKDSRFIHSLLDDERKGVQLLVKRWIKKKEAEEKLIVQFQQMSLYETELYSAGYQFIAGIDEVGRGPLAGPVIAAAAILPRDFYLPGLNDSKKLSEAKREAYYEVIVKKALATGIGLITAHVIDEVNIYQASKLAMQKAILQLSKKPDYLLIDAMKLPLEIPQKSIIKGDAKSISIAASSVFAKVTRDHLMKQFGKEYPQYGFEKHMGYGTKLHLEAIKMYGVTTIHRRTFSPVREALENG